MFSRRRKRPLSLRCAVGQGLPEFLDDRLLDSVVPWSQAPVVEGPRDAWRNGRYAHSTFTVPLGVLGRLTNPVRLDQIRLDVERLCWIGASLVERGVDEPLILIVDMMGRVALQDGHHRYLCALSQGWDRLPARLEVSDRLRSHGIPIHEVLGDFLLSAHS